MSRSGERSVDDARHARRDDVTQVITSVLDDYRRADAATVGPDAVADAIVAALEEHGFDVVWREPRDREE